MKQESLKEKQEYNEAPLPFALGDQLLSGGFLVIMGGIFLLGTLDVTIFGRSAWWLVALLPVYWIAVHAYRTYQRDGRFSRRVFAILVWSLLPFAYIIAAAQGWDMGAIWPLGIIAVGVSMLIFRSNK